jgi:formate/nitrite transporter FocA (FNT family)
MQGATKQEQPASRRNYDVVRQHGEEELKRPVVSVIWSGVAAGILISFSVVGEAILRVNLPDTSGRFLMENLGYSFGFLLVILGRMQLFTENTITTVLPLVAERSRTCLMATLRVWGIVLLANVVGALVAAAFFLWSNAFAEPMIEAINALSNHATGMPALESLARGVPAGILIAAIVWMMPSQSGNEVILIVLFTWLIAAGDFTHIIAGSVEMWFLILRGSLNPFVAFIEFFVPVLVGNVIGGTAVFTLLAWGQVQAEVE